MCGSDLEQTDVPVSGSPMAGRGSRSTSPPARHRAGRNSGWRHLDSFDVLAMPDPWEYPWFAAWDLAFHTITWAHLDPAFAKYQLLVLLREWFQHPNGALPAYEWSFDDVNPPGLELMQTDQFHPGGSTARTRRATASSAAVSWDLTTSALWIVPLPPGVKLDQADGTAWMAYYSVAMLALAVLLADRDSVYEDMVVKFLEQLVLVMDASSEELGLL